MGRRLSIACVAMGTAILLACDTTRGVLGTLSELQTVQAELAKALDHDEIQVNLHNNRFLFVGVVNSALGDLPDDPRRSKAKEIATIAYRVLPSRDSLEQVTVSFVDHKRYLLFINVTDTRDAFTFTVDELRSTALPASVQGNDGEAATEVTPAIPKVRP